MALQAVLQETIGPYKKQIETKIHESIQSLGPQTALRDACEYSLKMGGKRYRPALVMMVAKGVGFNADVSFAALGIEYFHTASLIADDLPCMDNDDERRDKPAVHKVYGESVALLASYVLISSGYGFLVKNGSLARNNQNPFDEEQKRLSLVLEHATITTGIQGASGGQFLDLYPPNLSIETIKDVIFKKTVTLFELAFVMGWVFGGGALNKLETVKKAAAHFGYAFQYADDLGDVEQDAANNRSVNIAAVCGLEKAKQMFCEEIDLFKKCLEELALKTNELDILADILVAKAGL